MTNKEAIKRLKWVKKRICDITYSPESFEALDVAIKALEEPKQGKFECRMKIKDVISMLLEFDMNEKATIHTTDEYKGNNIIISITDKRYKKEGAE